MTTVLLVEGWARGGQDLPGIALGLLGCILTQHIQLCSTGKHENSVMSHCMHKPEQPIQLFLGEHTKK